MSNTAQQQIVDDGAPRKYFHIMLNMADDDLDPYEYRLLGHYIRVGQCWESVRTTAEKTRMSVGKVHSTRKALAEKGYISLREHESGTTLVTIIDRWAENVARYAPKIVPDHDDVHTVNVDVHTVNVDVHEVKQRRTIEEEPTKKDSVANATGGEGEEPKTTTVQEQPTDDDSLFKAVLEEAWGIPYRSGMKLPKATRGHVNSICGALREMEQPPDPAELRAFYRAWKREHPDLTAIRAHNRLPLAIMKWRLSKDAKPAPREYVPTHVDVYVPPADVVNPVRRKETAA